jgi:hypothetical protein
VGRYQVKACKRADDVASETSLRDHGNMRTTLELDDELLATARRLAQRRSVTLGRVIPELARQSLPAVEPPKYRNGIRLLESRPGSPEVTWNSSIGCEMRSERIAHHEMRCVM